MDGNRKNLLTKSLSWTVVLTSVFALTVSTIAIAMVVFDWFMTETGSSVLSWFISALVIVGFLISLGTGFGLWLWKRDDETTKPEPVHPQTGEQALSRMVTEITQHKD